MGRFFTGTCELLYETYRGGKTPSHQGFEGQSAGPSSDQSVDCKEAENRLVIAVLALQ